MASDNVIMIDLNIDELGFEVLIFYDTLYVITLYHTTANVMIQGNCMEEWVAKQYPIIQSVLLQQQNSGKTWKHRTMSEVCIKHAHLPLNMATLKVRRQTKARRSNKKRKFQGILCIYDIPVTNQFLFPGLLMVSWWFPGGFIVVSGGFMVVSGGFML